jgi:hypothetical protein
MTLPLAASIFKRLKLEIVYPKNHYVAYTIFKINYKFFRTISLFSVGFSDLGVGV